MVTLCHDDSVSWRLCVEVTLCRGDFVLLQCYGNTIGDGYIKDSDSNTKLTQFQVDNKRFGRWVCQNTDSNQKPTLEENLGCFRAFCLSLKAFFNLGSLKMICPNVNCPNSLMPFSLDFSIFTHIFAHFYTSLYDQRV